MAWPGEIGLGRNTDCRVPIGEASEQVHAQRLRAMQPRRDTFRRPSVISATYPLAHHGWDMQITAQAE